MLRPKGCKKCGGSLYSEHDHYGSYVACFHCGAVIAYLSECAVPRPAVGISSAPEGRHSAQQLYAKPVGRGKEP